MEEQIIQAVQNGNMTQSGLMIMMILAFVLSIFKDEIKARIPRRNGKGNGRGIQFSKSDFKEATEDHLLIGQMHELAIENKDKLNDQGAAIAQLNGHVIAMAGTLEKIEANTAEMAACLKKPNGG